MLKIFHLEILSIPFDENSLVMFLHQLIYLQEMFSNQFVDVQYLHNNNKKKGRNNISIDLKKQTSWWC